MADPDLSYNERAHELVQQGKISEALNCYDEALEVNPNNDVILTDKAILLIRHERCEESLIFTKRAISINPEAVEAWVNMGLALDKLGRHQEASETLESAVLLCPYHAYAHAMLGTIYLKMDLNDRAAEQNRILKEIVFPHEYAGFFFALSAFLLGILLGGVMTVEGIPFEVSFGSELIIFFCFGLICLLYWRSHRMLQEISRQVIMGPYQLPKKKSYQRGLVVVITIMIVVFVIGIILGGNVRSYL
jgi:tetratricopeptide (TPR) repeat protein